MLTLVGDQRRNGTTIPNCSGGSPRLGVVRGSGANRRYFAQHRSCHKFRAKTLHQLNAMRRHNGCSLICVSMAARLFEAQHLLNPSAISRIGPNPS